MSPYLRQTVEGTVLSLHVQPRASRNSLAGIQGEELKVRLTSPPVDGAANRLCIEFLAKLLHLPKSAIVLVAGETSRHKRVLVRGLTPEEVRRSLVDSLS